MNQDIVTVGIASFGMSGRIFHAPLLAHHTGFQIARIVERSKREATALYPSIAVSRSFDDLLSDHSIDVVIVNTPDATHEIYARKCLEAGKHVVVEKPFTQTIQQGKGLIELARQKGKILTVFQNRRWDGDFLTVRKILDEKLLGDLVDYEAHFDRFKNSVQLESWKEQASAGAGVLFNLGSHMIDQALALFGMPTAVSGFVKTMRSGAEVDDWYDIRMHYPSVNVNVKSSLLVKEPGPRYLLHGTKGSFLKWGLDPQEEALKAGGDPTSSEWGREPEEWWGTLNTEIDGKNILKKFPTLPGNYLTFYDNLYKAIVYKKPLAVPAEEALNVIRIIEAVRISSREGRTVSL